MSKFINTTENTISQQDNPNAISQVENQHHYRHISITKIRKTMLTSALGNHHRIDTTRVTPTLLYYHKINKRMITLTLRHHSKIRTAMLTTTLSHHQKATKNVILMQFSNMNEKY